MIRGTEATDQPVSGSQSGSAHKLWRLGAALVVLTVLALMAWPAASRWLDAEHAVDLKRLRLATVERGDLTREVALTGHTVAAYHATLYSPARGLVDLAVQAGERAETGRLLATIESPELQNRLAQEHSTFEALGSELERQEIQRQTQELMNGQEEDLLTVEAQAAERAMRRAQSIFDAGLVNTIEYELAQDDLEVAKMALIHARKRGELERRRLGFEVRQAELALERQRFEVTELERQVESLRVTAPVDGIVSRLDVNDREAVERGQALVAMVDLSTFEVEVRVPQSQASEVTPGTRAEVTYQNERYEGQVRTMAPEVEAGGIVRGRVAFSGAPPPGLKQNEAVQVRLVLEARRDVLKLRRGPFLGADGGHFAYVLGDDGIARRRRIEVGGRSLAEVEIVAGLEAGEDVIISDTARFAGAQKVLVRD